MRPGALYIEVADGGRLRVLALEEHLIALAAEVAVLDSVTSKVPQDTAARAEVRVLERARELVRTLTALGLVGGG